jgi:hypothetical protein
MLTETKAGKSPHKSAPDTFGQLRELPYQKIQTYAASIAVGERVATPAAPRPERNTPMITRILLILCCLGILVTASGCVVYTAPAEGYYPYYPRRYYYYYSPRGYYYPYSYRYYWYP